MKMIFRSVFVLWIYVPLLVLCTLNFGCTSNGSPEWMYIPGLRCENLYGCNEFDSHAAFSLAEFKILRQDQRGVIVTVQSEMPPTVLLINFEAPGAADLPDQKHLLRDAWLVRIPKDIYAANVAATESPDVNEFVNPVKWYDAALFRRLCDEQDLQTPVNVISRVGTGNAVWKSGRLATMNVNLKTPGSIPLYVDFIEWERQLSRIFAARLEGYKADVGDRRGAALDRCLETPNRASCLIRGQIQGKWVRRWKPPI